MDRSFESEENILRPLYANEFTNSDGEAREYDSLTPSPSSVDPPVPLGPATPRNKERPATRATRSPVSTIAAAITQGTPEWYLRKLQDKTLDAQQLVSLQNTLRGKDVGWVNRFVELRGMCILARGLYQLSQKKHTRRRDDINMEQDIVKCITYILNQRSPTDIALSHNPDTTVAHVTSALNTSHLATRRFILDILVFLVYWNDSQAHIHVISALETLSEDNGETKVAYAYWFKSLQAVLVSRGKPVSTCGTNPQSQRQSSEADAALAEYAMSNILLMNGIMEAVDDLTLRLHHRSLMESSGLRTIISLFRELGIEIIDKQLDLFQQTLDDDQGSLDEQSSHGRSCDLSNIDEVYNALRAKTDNSKTAGYLLSILQHLSLIRDDRTDFMHHFQLVDSVVSDIVLDAKLGGAEKRIGLSVERMVSQLNQVERTQKLEEDLVKTRSAALELKLEKEELEDRLERSEQMIMHLQTIISRLDGQLTSPRSEAPVSVPVPNPEVAYGQRLAQLADHAQVDPPRGLFRSPLLGSGSESKEESPVKPEPTPASPPPTASKLAFWGITSWLGIRQNNANESPTPVISEIEKTSQDFSGVAV